MSSLSTFLLDKNSLSTIRIPLNLIKYIPIMAPKAYPVGESSFPAIRKDGKFYVDKTQYIHKLISEGKYYFLSRPRRFGKSLLVSTMEAFFSGEKNLFKDLAIEKMEKEWINYPVFRIDLSAEDMTRHDGLMALLHADISEWEGIYGRNENETTLPTRFRGVIRRAHAKTGRKVVVLIDEYDNPLFSTIDDNDTHLKMRNTLKAFYSVLKAEDDHLHFCFLTGITRFSKMTVFSGLNNLEDITLSSDYAAICGISQEELEDNCRDGIMKMAESNGWSTDETIGRLKSHYDGYHFSAVSPDIYNPYSLIQALKNREISSYWFASGTSHFLWRQLDKIVDSESLQDFLSPVLTYGDLGASEDDGLSLAGLLFQTGYLTIKGKTPSGRAYQLCVPNEEVKEGIMYGLLHHVTENANRPMTKDLEKLRAYADNGDAEKLMNHLKSFLSKVSYRITEKKSEIYFENNLFLLFNLIGIETRVEVETSYSRMDIMMRCARFIYIIELKLDKSAEEALRQICEKEYALPFMSQGLPIIRIGVNFSSVTNNILSWKIDKIMPLI